jgi:hypothetical protein
MGDASLLHELGEKYGKLLGMNRTKHDQDYWKLTAMGSVDNIGLCHLIQDIATTIERKLKEAE